ncbi:substrate-binding domain-containing protein [Celeribacter naphthalenivorans]|uniref:substrate-binding domain-containing protein n=1 Tax=Celeribacter naphthalenivorans TaxID=1614694 RepID=UPI001CFC139B|nr:substrate-binding domain-containing protein [Celeribacter naphthalenivorans]
MKLTSRKIAFAATTALSLAATAAFAEDVPSWCGPDNATLALLDGSGGNSWRQITSASAREEAEKCPSITDFFYADGQGDTQKSISDIKSFAARGVDAMVVFGDAGPAVLPALTAAHRAGVTVVPYRQQVGGEEGVNYAKFVSASFVSDGVNFGNFIKREFPDGAKMLFLSGPAGNSVGLEMLEGLNSVLDERYEYLNPAPFHVTNWDPALTQQVLTAEIAKHPQIDVIISDYGASLIGGLPAFERNGRSIPAITTESVNLLGCFWQDKQANNPDFKLLTRGGGNENGRLAAQWAIALATGGTPPETSVYTSEIFEDSVTGEPSEVQCRRDLPGEIYLSAKLSPEKQLEAINQ